MTTSLPYSSESGPTVYPTGGPEWRATEAALFDYYRRSLNDARVQRRLKYPKRGADHIIVCPPFVWKVAREIATTYRRAPRRTWETPDGKPLADAAQKRLARIYKSIDVDQEMRTADEHVVALGNATLWVWPQPETQGVTITLVPPHHQEVEFSRVMSKSVKDVDKWRLQLPVNRDGDIVDYGVVEITAATAKWISGPNEGKGLWTEDGSNPLGEIPVVMMRASAPAPGEWWAPAPDDLLQVQRALMHAMTDLKEIHRFQGFSQPVARGVTDQDQLEVGHETLVALTSPEASFSFESPDADFAGGVSINDQILQVCVSHLGLNPQSFLKSSGITAQAKRIELIDRDAEREARVLMFERAEERLYSLIARWFNTLRGAGDMPEARVRVTHYQQRPPVDELHAAQAVVIERESGLNSSVRERAERLGIPLDEAEALVLEDIAFEGKAHAARKAAGLVEEPQQEPQPRDDQGDDQPATDAAGNVADVAENALNGAQITAVLEVAARVGGGTLTFEAGVALLVEGLGISDQTARRVLSGAQPPAPTPAPVQAVG